MRYFLDATFIIDHLRRDASAVAKMRAMMEDGDELFINEVVACEAWSGRRSPEDDDLARLLTVPEFIQAGPSTAERAGRWRTDARLRGWTLSTADALISTAAEAVGATILTRNQRDFALTPVPVATY